LKGSGILSLRKCVIRANLGAGEKRAATAKGDAAVHNGGGEEIGFLTGQNDWCAALHAILWSQTTAGSIVSLC